MAEEYLSIPQLAQMLRVSRMAIYRKVKAGRIPSQRIGRNYAIPKKYVAQILGHVLGEKEKKLIEAGVARAVKDYGETLKLLGRE